MNGTSLSRRKKGRLCDETPRRRERLKTSGLPVDAEQHAAPWRAEDHSQPAVAIGRGGCYGVGVAPPAVGTASIRVPIIRASSPLKTPATVPSGLYRVPSPTPVT